MAFSKSKTKVNGGELKMRKNKWIFLVIVLFLIAVCLLYNNKNWLGFYESDNETLITQTESKKYTEQEIEELKKGIFSDHLTVKQFIMKYNPKCIRKTSQGYYAILMQNDDIMCFVFWDNGDHFLNIYKTDGFTSHEKFQNSIDIGVSNFNDITSSDMNYFAYPVSKMMMTGHIFTDGVVLIQYDTDSFAVKSSEFYSNEDLATTVDYLIPYILPKDRVSTEY